MLFRSVMFGAFGQTKTWLATQKDGSLRPLRNADYYKVRTHLLTVCLAFRPSICAIQKQNSGIALQAGAVTGTIAAFVEGPIDFYKSQIQVQIIRSRADPNYKRRRTSLLTSLVESMHVQQLPNT